MQDSQYIIESIILTTDRIPGYEFDLNGAQVELNIYEDIEKPFLTANLVNVDNAAFKYAVGITGSERIEIKLKIPGGPIRTKRFMVTSISKEISINEKTQVRSLTMIEEHGYLSQILKFSKTVKGLPSQIISDVYASQLNKNVVFESFDAVQRPMRINVPYWTPMQLCEWVRDRMTNEYGAGFFLYAAFRDDDIHLTDLETAFVTPPWNESSPYVYGQMAPLPLNHDNAQRSFFHIKSVTSENLESTFKLAQAGAIGSGFSVFDLTSGNFVYTHHDGSETIRRLNAQYTENLSLPFDDTLMITGNSSSYQNITQYPSKNFSQVVQSQMFDDLNGYHDERDDASMYLLKLRNGAIRTALLNNTYTITVPGVPYLARDDIGIGTNIDISYFLNTTHDENANNFDWEKSGKFMIYRQRHQFTENIYECTMDVARLTREDLPEGF